jgi:hypothetical protein
MRQFACVNTERKGDAPHQQRTYIAAVAYTLACNRLLIVSTSLANHHAKKEKEKKSPTSKSISFND